MYTHTHTKFVDIYLCVSSPGNPEAPRNSVPADLDIGSIFGSLFDEDLRRFSTIRRVSLRCTCGPLFDDHASRTPKTCRIRQYGVATISRLLNITGLVCERALLKRQYSAKETYDFEEPTDRSHPIPLEYLSNTGLWRI